MINIYTLHYFHVTAQHLSFSKAAKHLFITQPALAKQIQQLEEQLQVKLFDRTRRVVKLTDAGKILMEQCRHVFDSLNELETAMAKFGSQTSGTLRIASVASIGNYLLPDFLILFGNKFPSVKLHAVVRPVDEILDLLRVQEVDFGLVNTDAEHDDLISIDMGRQRLVFICSKNCRNTCSCAEQDYITIVEMAGCRLMSFDRSTATRRMLDHLAREHGVRLNIPLESENVEMVKQMVIRGHGGAIVPAYSIRKDEAENFFIIRRIRESSTIRPLRLYYNKNTYMTGAHVEFLSMFADFFAANPETSFENEPAFPPIKTAAAQGLPKT